MLQGEVVVSVTHASGTAGVIVDRDGDVWLSGALEGGGGTLLDDYRPAIEGVGDGRIVEGGRLPPGAVAAIVVDVRGRGRPAAAGGGAWVIALEDHALTTPQPVRYEDGAGAVVASPLPGDWPREPLDDAGEPCPACSAFEWDVVTPLDDSRGGTIGDSGEVVPNPISVCRRCGHEEAAGSFYVGIDADEDYTGSDEDYWSPAAAEALAQVTFPVYVVRGRAGRVGAYGSHGSGRSERITTITVEHGDPGEGPWIAVESEIGDERVEDDPSTAARAALQQTLGMDSWPDLSEPALSLWLAARERDRERTAAESAVEGRTLPVAGRAAGFTVATSGDRWAATAHDLEVTVSARGVPIEDVELVTLEDPGTLLS